MNDHPRRIGGRRGGHWRKNLARWFGLLGLVGLLPHSSPAADVPLVPRGQRFERSLRSELSYPDPDAIRVQVEVRTPQGETQIVPGFWDGGRTWRFRALPGVAGRWSYRTTCADTNNAGLHQVSGEFLCTAGERGQRFREHGGIRVAREGTSFEHADRTPFFLVTELAWNAVRRETAREFETRLAAANRRGINTLAWTLWPGKDDRGESALGEGSGTVNVEFFQRLEARVDAITRAGLVNLIAPAWEMRGESSVGEAAVAAAWRQALGRWHANPSLWLLAVESSSGGVNIGRWKRIAAEVFSGPAPGPVIFLPGETHWLWEEFRAEEWVSALGLKTAHLASDDELQWLLAGPIAVEHRRAPPRPVLDLFPRPPGATQAANVSARQLLWWGLLLNPPAGVSLPGEPGPANRREAALLAAEFMGGIDFRRLRPAPRSWVKSPGGESPRRFVAVAASEQGDLVVAYTPEGPSVELASAAVPARHSDTWFNPATGERILAAGVVGRDSVVYRTPGPGDWVLLIHGER